ncbi:neuroglian [Aplysia californica]|uniref:Neuroglian n=1 Tax=Aplysia californica TaxID=6500 RepID=A0ABM1AAG5_APLCA|nr:neuroglian [Aplysia californica]
MAATEPQVTVAGFGLDKNRPLTQTAAHFVWEAIDPKDRKINGKFRGYKILYWEVTDERHKREVYVPVSGQPVAAGHLVKASVPDLPAYSSIRVQVVVVNTHYQGPPSDVEDVFTPEGTPSAVEGLFADVVTHNSVTLRWLPPDHSNGIITGYDIGYQPVLGNRLGPVRPVLRRSNNPRVFQERIEGLKSNHRYRFHIMATTRAGRGQQSFIDVKTDNYTGKPGERGPTIQRPYNDNPMENDDDSNSALSPLSSPLLYSLPALTLTLYSTLLPVFQVVCCS